MSNIKDYDTNCKNSWCPGCGNFPILAALKETLHSLQLKHHEVVVVSGIGQAAKTPHYINTNGFNGLHGRALPPAFGIKTANKNLKVIVTSGDGDSYGEGGNHIIHNIRRNINIAHFVHNNQIYGLTKGQGSPTTALGHKTTLQYEGVISDQFNPIAFAISLGCGFVARSFSGDKEHLMSMMKSAIEYNGYALVDILQPCITFNKINTFKWYKDRVYRLDEKHNPYDISEAFKKSQEWEEKIPIGVIFRQDRPSFIERVPQLFKEPPLVNRKWCPLDAKEFMDEFK